MVWEVIRISFACRCMAFVLVPAFAMVMYLGLVRHCDYFKSPLLPFHPSVLESHGALVHALSYSNPNACGAWLAV